MKIRLVVMGLMAFAGCQCFTPVDEGDVSDGLSHSPSDASVTVQDASVARVDASVIALDASVVIDASVVEVDASVEIDASVTFDGGDEAVDAGVEYLEPCDGIDNDSDGLIDLRPDGGQLTRACQLDVGVCALLRSVCVDGGFTECDYGPDYEPVERRCDGLDNDCDGRIDRSRPSTILMGDGALNHAFLGYQQVLQTDAGFVVTFANHSIWLDAQLNVQRHTVFGEAPQFHNTSQLALDQHGWVRVHASQVLGQTEAVVTVQRLEADGGGPLIAEYAGAFTPEFSLHRAGAELVVMSSGGVSLATALTTLRISVDGGVTRQTLRPAGIAPWVSHATSNGFVAAQTLARPCEVVRCDLVGTCATVFAPDDRCFIASDPLIVRSADDWLTEDGGLFARTASPTDVWFNGSTTAKPMASRKSNGGVDLLVITAQAPVVFEHLNQGSTEYSSMTGIDDRLFLLTWSDLSTLPPGNPDVWPVDRVNAEYVCVP